MKSGITLVLLLGAVTGIAGAILRATHYTGGNGLMVGGLFVAVMAVAFLMLQNAQKQHD